VGGITEWQKIAAMCETHYVGMIPHFTGPVSLAALVHVLGSSPVPAVAEIAGGVVKMPPHLAEAADFREGKLWPNDRPGLGVTFLPAGAELIAEVTERHVPLPIYCRPDGLLTNW
jgi:L-alanine-DL-glutamate epimerase-like enolase superfamily enzyme